MMASGPYATDVSASRDSADSPSTGVICSRETSRARTGGPTRTCQSARIRLGRLRVRAVMLNGTCIAGYADTRAQPSCVTRLVSAALGRDDETVSDFIGSSLPRAFGHRLQTAPPEAWPHHASEWRPLLRAVVIDGVHSHHVTEASTRSVRYQRSREAGSAGRRRAAV